MKAWVVLANADIGGDDPVGVFLTKSEAQDLCDRLNACTGECFDVREMCLS